MLETHLRQAATALLESAIQIAPPDTREWGEAMRGELAYVEGPWAGLMWAIGGATVLAKSALAAVLIPSRHGQGLVPDGGLFAKTVSLRKAALIAGGACVLGALLFFAAPPFRQGIRVSLEAWQWVYSSGSSAGQPALAGLAKRAEAQRDPQGLAFCAVRVSNPRESARLAEEAVRLDPDLKWIYAIAAIRHPDLPETRQWLLQLERQDPQNALLHLITAKSIDFEHLRIAPRLTLQEIRKQRAEDPAWRSAMAATFGPGELNDYGQRLAELDRSVVSRYSFNHPYEVLEGEDYEALNYAFEDTRQFAQSLLQSGQILEAQGDKKGAAEKYWTVARFGQLLDSQGRSDLAHLAGTVLQRMAYEQLQALSSKEGNSDEAALFGYLVEKSNLALRQNQGPGGRWVFGAYVARRNAAFLQISGLLMLIFSGLAIVGATILFVGSRHAAPLTFQRAKPAATVIALAGSVGMLLSSATVYLTYRPYWYIFQRTIFNGDRSGIQDLRYFLEAAQVPPGTGSQNYFSLLSLPFYFWTGVTLLGLIGLVLILLRHLRTRPQASVSA